MPLEPTSGPAGGGSASAPLLLTLADGASDPALEATYAGDPLDAATLLQLGAGAATVLEVGSDGGGIYTLDDGAGAFLEVHRKSDDAHLLKCRSFGVELAGDSPQMQAIVGSCVQFLTAAAPPSGDLNASGFALWLDATPGATKLMVKAKDSGGTVRTAAIPLA